MAARPPGGLNFDRKHAVCQPDRAHFVKRGTYKRPLSDIDLCTPFSNISYAIGLAQKRACLRAHQACMHRRHRVDLYLFQRRGRSPPPCAAFASRGAAGKWRTDIHPEAYFEYILLGRPPMDSTGELICRKRTRRVSVNRRMHVEFGSRLNPNASRGALRTKPLFWVPTTTLAAKIE